MMMKVKSSNHNYYDLLCVNSHAMFLLFTTNTIRFIRCFIVPEMYRNLYLTSIFKRNVYFICYNFVYSFPGLTYQYLEENLFIVLLFNRIKSRPRRLFCEENKQNITLLIKAWIFLLSSGPVLWKFKK